jgi:hypothetical protein
MTTTLQDRGLRNGVMFLTVAALFTSSCTPRLTEPAAGPFDGSWRVRWCDKERPDLACGGFWLTLVQRGSQICGTHAAARINLSQVDEVEDASVKGVVVGNTARLTIESGQSGGVYSAVATLDGNAMHWKLGELVVSPEYDVPVFLADGELLHRDSEASREEYERAQRVCVSAFPTTHR